MPDTPTPSGSTDILSALLADHRAVESMFGRYDQLPAAGRGDYFGELVPVLVGHEVAEEEILYPAVRSADEKAEPVVRERIEEQSEAEELLKKMEKMDPTSDDFAAAFTKLRSAVLEHAEKEEQTVFPLLDEHRDRFDRDAMGAAYQRAKDAAPTHPHPLAPDTPPGNVALGPVAAIADRVRDALAS